MVIKVKADAIKVNGPLKDGSYSITFSTGEYEQLNVSKLLMIPQMTELEIEVKYGG